MYQPVINATALAALLCAAASTAPDRAGRIPQGQVDALMELKRALDGRAKH
jgi:hypothetical protein